MAALKGCAMCKALMSAPASVHDEHITHREDGTHRVECTTPPCTHYGQGG